MHTGQLLAGIKQEEFDPETCTFLIRLHNFGFT